MNKLLLGAALVVAITIAALGGWFFSHTGGNQAQADPGPTVAFDMGNADNTPSNIVDIDPCYPGPGLGMPDGGSFDFDVVVENLEPADDYAGNEYYITWAGEAGGVTPGVPIFSINSQIQSPPPAGVLLIGVNPASGPYLDTSQGAPDAATPHKLSVADLSGTPGAEANPPYTEGVMGRYNATVGPGVAPGLYDLEFGSQVPYPAPIVANSGAADQCVLYGCTYLDGASTPGYGRIAVLPTLCPQPADLKKLGFSMTALNPAPGPGPDDIDVSTTYTMDITSIVHNNGPETPVNATDKITVSPPAGVTISYHNTMGEQVWLDLDGDTVYDVMDPPVPSFVSFVSFPQTLQVRYPVVLPASVVTPIVTNWDLHCAAPSTHTVTWVNDLTWGGEDPNPNNNDGTISLTVNCLAEADVKVPSVVVDPLDLPAAKPPLPYPTIYTDTNVVVPATVTVHNNGPFGPVTATAGSSAGLYPALPYVGMAAVNGDCTVVGGGGSQPSLAVSTALVLNPNFTVNCSQGGIELDDDGDGLTDEDPVNGVDDDSDWLLGPPGGPCAPSGVFGCDEDSPFYLVNVQIGASVAAPKDAHVTDPDLTNNANGAVVTLAVIRPFTPSFAAYMDTANPDVATSPAPNSTCIDSPGASCKTESIAKVPASMLSTPGWTEDGQPLAGIATITGEGPGVFAWNNGLAITPNGQQTGFIQFVVHTDGGLGGPCNITIAGSTPLTDACLPPPAYPGVAFTVNEAGCLVDAGGQGPALIPPPGTANFSWSSGLDPEVSLIQSFFPAGQAFLWARYSGFAVVLGSTIPVNVLVFDLSGGLGMGPWLSWGATGNPAAPPVAFGPTTCSPFSADTIILGETAAPLSQTIKYCTALAPATGDFAVNDGCPANGAPETGAQCLNSTDDDGDLLANDGCPADGAAETGAQCLNYGNDDGPHWVTGQLTRQDLGEQDVTIVPFSCLPPETDQYCTLTKDETPSVGINVLGPAEPVIINVTNGAGPDDSSVDAALLSPISCPAVWLDDPAIPSMVVQPPMIVGLNQISRVSFQMSDVAPGGVLGPGETRPATVNYQADNCQLGNHTYQITANVGPKTVPDPNLINNQCENHPVMSATDDDVDDDTVVNWVDNCPYVVNPDQANADGDALGDACDPDDDNDGILDGADACPFVAEDVDGEDDLDGCPDSDAHDITVVKNNDYDVDVSVNHVETVTTTIVNGNYGLYAPNGMHFTELLISDVSNPNDKCEARWIPQPGDACVEDVIDGKLFSQCEVTIPNVPPYDPVSKTRQYTVHCNERSTHTIFLEESAVPAIPVVDPDVQNGNVHKQYITVNSWDLADVKELTYVVHTLNGAPYVPGADIAASATVPFVTKKVLHNNGPSGPVTVAISRVNTPAAGCTITPVNVATSAVLPVSVQVVIFDDWTIHCTTPSTHTSSMSNSVATNETHLRDPNPGNNSGTASLVVDVIGSADVKVISAGFAGLPSEIDLSQNVAIKLRGILHNNGPAGPVSAQVSMSATAPADCTLTPNTYTAQVSLPVSVDVDVQVDATLHCSQPSTHRIANNVSVGAPKDVHIVDPSMANNGPVEGAINVAVLATTDVKVNSLSAPDNMPGVPSNQIVVQPSVPEVFNTSAALHNNGPFGPVNVAYQANVIIGTCAGIADVLPATHTGTAALNVSSTIAESDAWTVHWIDMKKPPYSCDLTITKSIDGSATHISDPVPANNSKSVTITMVRDTDNDGVVDNYAGIRDNCQDVPNPDQTDSDGDGLGDACDAHPSHEVVVKHCFKFGPAPANLSDTTGRYMWAICEIGNLESYVEGVTLTMDVTGNMPAGCSQLEQLILPGQETFLLQPNEQKWVLYRLRYECHDPATPAVYNLNVKFCADPIEQPFDDDGDTLVDEDPIDGIDNDGDSLIDEDTPEGTGPVDCHEQIRQLIVHQP